MKRWITLLKSLGLRSISIMIVIGVVGLIFLNLIELWGAVTHSQWQTTEGKVIENYGVVHRTRRGRYWSNFTYSYEVNGQVYTGKRLWFFEQIIGPTKAELQAALDTYPRDSDITVTYSSTFPQQAVIFAQVEGVAWLGVITAGFCIIPGFMILLALAVGLWQHEQKNDINEQENILHHNR